MLAIYSVEERLLLLGAVILFEEPFEIILKLWLDFYFSSHGLRQYMYILRVMHVFRTQCFLGIMS